MEDALHRFHTFKHGFLHGQAGKMAKAKPIARRTELFKKGKVHEKRNAETCTPSKKRHEINTWRDYISHEIEGSSELDANFKSPKMHLMIHWVEQIYP